MNTDNNFENNNECRGMKASNIAKNALFFMAGGAVGAVVALLFAPKSGRDLRQDIADSATKTYETAIDAVDGVKAQAVEYLDAAKEFGGEIVETVAKNASSLNSSDSSSYMEVRPAMEMSAPCVGLPKPPMQFL